MTEKLEKNDFTLNGTIIPRTKMLSTLPIFWDVSTVFAVNDKCVDVSKKKGRAYNIIALVNR